MCLGKKNSCIFWCRSISIPLDSYRFCFFYCCSFLWTPLTFALPLYSAESASTFLLIREWYWILRKTQIRYIKVKRIIESKLFSGEGQVTVYIVTFYVKLRNCTVCGFFSWGQIKDTNKKEQLCWLCYVSSVLTCFRAAFLLF